MRMEVNKPGNPDSFTCSPDSALGPVLGSGATTGSKMD